MDLNLQVLDQRGQTPPLSKVHLNKISKVLRVKPGDAAFAYNVLRCLDSTPASAKVKLPCSMASQWAVHIEFLAETLITAKLSALLVLSVFMAPAVWA